MKKILVAMSGGVDSSVAAALLKAQRLHVAGGYMKNFSPEAWQGVVAADCPWEQDVADAKVVCDKLGIEFRSFNFENEYRAKVIDYFFTEYAQGRTPNPDVMCNKEIKFGLFLEKALESGFDYIATGHYARVTKTSSFSPPHEEGRGEVMEYNLLKGTDSNKDQSYFLYSLNQFQLSHALFPIGDYTKVEVRALARQFGLPNAGKKDSQGLCFVGQIKLREFLKQRIPERVGEIVTTTGEVIGQHRGAAYYTIGQRQGIGLGARPPSLRPSATAALACRAGSGVSGRGGMPYYVVAKNIVQNQIVVAEGKTEIELYTNEVFLQTMHWINTRLTNNLRSKIPGQLRCKAKIRYRQEDQECTVIPLRPPARPGGGRRQGEGAIVEFKDPQFAPAAGQSVVFYDGERILGGGIIG